MGLEAYLFRLSFRKNVDFSSLNNFLLDSGFKIVKKEGDPMSKSETCYELASKKGITETILRLEQKWMHVLNVRFSVMSPPNVIDQTFTFFKILNETYGFKLYDTEVHAYIPIDVEESKKNKMGIWKRKSVLSDDKRKKPIRCGETFASKHFYGT